MNVWPIGVFSSLDEGLGVKFEVVEELGIPTIQLHAPSPSLRNKAQADAFRAKLDEAGVRLTVVFAGFPGESYADIPTVIQTVGLVPPETRAERLADLISISDFAHLLGCSSVGLHLGFIGHDPQAGDYRDVVAATRTICDHCESLGQTVHLETGQETAADLLTFLGEVNRSNLVVNFDPANMILYGSGEPIEALGQLGPHVKSVHCKDATWSDQPGVTWGAEVALGDGEVGLEAYLRKLHEIGYTGPLTIEREIPQDPERQKREIGQAVERLTKLRSAILGTE